MAPHLVMWALSMIFVMAGFISSASAQAIELFEEGDFPEPGQSILDEGESDDQETPPGLIIDRGDGAGQGAERGRTIRLEYERAGQSIFVKAAIGRHDVYFIFDTGASYTTLTSEFAALVGATPQANNPRAMMQTAGGLREAPFGLLPSLRLGHQRLENVTFTICDACGNQYKGLPVVGLLGLNVLRRYRISMDDSNGVLELSPHRGFDDRSADIEPWVEGEILASYLDTSAGQMMSRVEVRNLSPRALRGLVVEIVCQTARGEERRARAQKQALSARGSAQITLPLNMMGCVQVGTRVLEGRW